MKYIIFEHRAFLRMHYFPSVALAEVMGYIDPIRIAGERQLTFDFGGGTGRCPRPTEGCWWMDPSLGVDLIGGLAEQIQIEMSDPFPE